MGESQARKNHPAPSLLPTHAAALIASPKRVFRICRIGPPGNRERPGLGRWARRVIVTQLLSGHAADDKQLFQFSCRTRVRITYVITYA